jgi:hypothetical protein
MIRQRRHHLRGARRFHDHVDQGDAGFAEGSFLAGKPERFETMLNNVINGALKGVKEQTQEAMAKMMQGSGMSDMFGGEASWSRRSTI